MVNFNAGRLTHRQVCDEFSLNPEVEKGDVLRKRSIG